MTDTTQAVGLTALAFGILQILKTVVESLLAKKSNGGNGKSGEKDPAFWKLEFKTIQEDVSRDRVEPRLDLIVARLDSILVRLDKR